MAAILKVCMMSYQKRNSVNQCVFYLKNIPAKFHPSPISNDKYLGFFEEVTHQEQDE